MATGREMAAALLDSKVLRQQAEAVKAAKLARALAGLRDGTHKHATDAAEAVGLSADLVRAAWRKEKTS